MSDVDAWIAALPEPRREVVERLRAAIRAKLPEGYEEGRQYGMLGWYVPHARYPAGYHCDPSQPVPFAHVGSPKGHLGVYLFCVYLDPELRAWFEAAYAKTGRKLDMGGACVRFKRMEDVPVELIADTLARVPVDAFLARYEAGLPASARKKLGK